MGDIGVLVSGAYADVMNRIGELERELAAKRKLLRFLERDVLGMASAAPEGERAPASRGRRRKGRGLTIREAILAVLDRAGRPVTTPEIRESLDDMGIKAARISVYGAVSGMAKEGILKPHPHAGRGNAYTIV